MVHSPFLVCLFLFYTRFGRQCVHLQEKQLYLCDTSYLLFCVDDCLLCRVEWNLAYQTMSYKYKGFSWWRAHCCPKHVEERNKHIKKKLCTRLVLFTGLYKQARHTLWDKWFNFMYSMDVNTMGSQSLHSILWLKWQKWAWRWLIYSRNM